jgi:hypothetical protein
MTDVHKITIQVRAPRGSFPGEVAEGHYVVFENAVILTDEKGKPIGEGKRQLNHGDDARLIACLMLRSRRRSRASVSAFNAPIAYPKAKYL